MKRLALALALLALRASAAGTRATEAERMAGQALQHCGAGGVAQGQALARKALALTEEFEPTEYVAAGRKGEVVEDAFLDARRQYRTHRARLYDAVGACLDRAGRPRAASRFLRRAALLQPNAARATALAPVLIADGRAAEALAALRSALRGPAATPDAEWTRLVEQAVDAARLPSAQVELDRWRLDALKAPNVTHVTGPLRLAPEARLSTGTPFAWSEQPALIYVASVSCRDCSAHLQQMNRALAAYRNTAGAAEARVLVLPEEPDQDHALRQVLALYRYPWPVLLGRGHPAALGVKPGHALIVARDGWSAAVIRPPFGEELSAALGVLSRRDVTETRPRPNWSRRPAERAVPEPPGLVPEGLAPGEDEPAPAAFTAAVDAFRAGRPLEALRFLESLEKDPEGWLLPPEARFNRALALRAMGEREAARRLLLRIGDSRLQDAVDRALEAQPAR